MGITTMTPASAADYVAKLEVLLLAAGWTDTTLTGSNGGNILVSAADAESRVTYIELYDDGTYVWMAVSPALNDAGTGLHPYYVFDNRGTNVNTGVAHDVVVYDDFFFVRQGTSAANYWLLAGCLKVNPNIVNPEITHRFSTMYGGQRTGTPSTLSLAWMNKGGGSGSHYGFSTCGIRHGLSPLIWQSPTVAGVVYYFQAEFPGDDLWCSPFWQVSSSNNVDGYGLMGRVPHCIVAYSKNKALIVGDTVTVGGVTYQLVGTVAGIDKTTYSAWLLWEV